MDIRVANAAVEHVDGDVVGATIFTFESE